MSKKSGVSVYGVVRTTKKTSKTYTRKIRKWSYHKKGAKKGEKWYKRKVKTKVTRTTRRTTRQGRRINVYGTPEQVKQALEKIHSESLVPQEQYVSVSALDLLIGVPEISPSSNKVYWDTEPEEDES